MDITHKTRSQVATGKGKGLCLLTDRKGGYALFGDHNFSHFCGLTHLLPDEWTLFKSVDAIHLDQSPTSVTNKFFCVQRRCGAALEEYFSFNNTLYYAVDSYHGKVTVDLDMRRIYDFSDVGRFYKMYSESGAIVVEYSKFADDSCSGDPQRFFLVIRGAKQYTVLNDWQPRSYPYDAARGNAANRWVFRALRFDCDGGLRLSFTFGRDKGVALRASEVAWHDWQLIRGRLKRFAQSVKTDDSVAYSAAVFSLESLVASVNSGVNRTGVYAGLPWFFQFWARDELLSLQGLVLAEKYALVKEVLLLYLDRLQPDGRLPNMFPPSTLGSADAVGWLFKRLHDLLVHLDERKLVFEYFSSEELAFVCDRLERSLLDVQSSHLRDGLVLNSALETWMDTHGGTGDVRAGARIEIQALTLASLRCLFFLYKLLKRGNGRSFRDFERSLASRTREVFFRDGLLFDGKGDATQRPNIFLAAYAYPDLLTRREWSVVFDKALERLWLDWGGLASLDRDHPLFVDTYTGHTNRSYHRGDSWYWVNNLAALVLHRLDSQKYAYHVKAIRDASVHELLFGGVAGHAAEVSSAKRQESAGCFAQAWSAATLIELLSETDS